MVLSLVDYGLERLPAPFYRSDRGPQPLRLASSLGREARVIFSLEQPHMVLLHGFIRKSRKTPQGDIELALKRKRGGDR